MPKLHILEELLETVQVGVVDDSHNEANDNRLTGVLGWHHVSDSNGVRAYLNSERDALAYRLFLINATLNPVVAE